MGSCKDEHILSTQLAEIPWLNTELLEELKGILQCFSSIPLSQSSIKIGDVKPTLKHIYIYPPQPGAISKFNMDNPFPGLTCTIKSFFVTHFPWLLVILKEQVPLPFIMTQKFSICSHQSAKAGILRWAISSNILFLFLLPVLPEQSVHIEKL